MRRLFSTDFNSINKKIVYARKTKVLYRRLCCLDYPSLFLVCRYFIVSNSCSRPSNKQFLVIEERRQCRENALICVRVYNLFGRRMHTKCDIDMKYGGMGVMFIRQTKQLIAMSFSFVHENCDEMC